MVLQKLWKKNKKKFFPNKSYNIYEEIKDEVNFKYKCSK